MKKVKNKSIIFFVGSLGVGGAGKMVNYVSSICREIYSKVYVVSFYDDIEDDAKYENVEYYSFHFVTKKRFWRFRAIKEIRAFVNAIKPDVVCSFVSDIAFMTRVATLFSENLVFISAERGDPYILPIVWKVLISWTYNTSDYCFFQLEKARDFFGLKIVGKSFVVPNPFLGSEIAPYFGKRKKTVVTAIRFEREKGVDLLINAFAKIHNDFPEYQLIIYGAGSLLLQYKEMTISLGIKDFVSFPGYVKNVAEAVREDGIFVLPSRYEGIPNNLIEVLAVGIPAIAADCSPGGPRFLLREGKSGLLFPVDDVKALEECIRMLIKDEKLYQQMQERGSDILEDIAEPKIRKIWKEAFLSIHESNN